MNASNDTARLAGSTVMLFLCAFTITGCTGFGFLIGRSIDNHTIVIPADQAEIAAEEGESAEIELKEGAVLSATIIRIAPMRDSLYRERYAAWQSSSAVPVPQLGSWLSIDFRRSSIASIGGRFAGFDADALLLDGRPVPIGDVRSIMDSVDGEIDVDFLAESVLDNTLPLRAELLLNRGRDVIRVPLSAIERVQIERGRVASVLMTALGLIGDIVVIPILVKEMRPKPWFTWPRGN